MSTIGGLLHNRLHYATARSKFGRGPFLIYIISLAIVLLWPMEFITPVEKARNGVGWAPTGPGVVFIGPGIVLSGPSSWVRRVKENSNGFSVATWVRPYDTYQRGPARIVASSQDKHLANFVIGQRGDDLEVRLRTSQNNGGGTGPSTLLPNVLSESNITHITITFNGTSLKIYVDGSQRLNTYKVSGDTANWDLKYPLILGNEATGNRPWIGQIFRVSLFDRELTAVEVARLNQSRPHVSSATKDEFDAVIYSLSEGAGRTAYATTKNEGDSLTIPEILMVKNKLLLAQAYREVKAGTGSLLEMIGNVLIFIPVGLLLRLIATPLTQGNRRIMVQSVGIIVLASLVALSAEVAQFWIAGRESSWTDVIHNTVGGAIGVGFAHVLTRYAVGR